jgi:hypothetical protein
MEFRWVAAIALWTMLSGPVFCRLAAVTPQAPNPKAPGAAVSKTAPTPGTPLHR